MSANTAPRAAPATTLDVILDRLAQEASSPKVRAWAQDLVDRGEGAATSNAEPDRRETTAKAGKEAR